MMFREVMEPLEYSALMEETPPREVGLEGVASPYFLFTGRSVVI